MQTSPRKITKPLCFALQSNKAFVHRFAKLEKKKTMQNLPAKSQRLTFRVQNKNGQIFSSSLIILKLSMLLKGPIQPIGQLLKENIFFVTVPLKEGSQAKVPAYKTN